MHARICLTIDNHVTAFKNFIKNFIDVLLCNHHHLLTIISNPIQSMIPTKTQQTQREQLKEWTARLYTALNDREGYGRAHMTFFREFEKLSDEARGSKKRSILPYVEPVFNHTASQGYHPQLHYDALFQAMSAYCQHLPPPAWVPPLDQFDRSPTPTLPPSVPKKSSPTPIAPVAKSKKADKTRKDVPTTSREKPAPSSKEKPAPSTSTQKPTPTQKDAPTQTKPMAKGRAPAKPIKLKPSNAYVDDSSDREIELSDGGNLAGETKPLQKELVKCNGCEKDGNPCLINPSTVNKESPACYECFMGKRKCSLCKKAEGGRRRKPAAVAPGAAGELARKSLTLIFYLRLTSC